MPELIPNPNCPICEGKGATYFHLFGNESEYPFMTIEVPCPRCSHTEGRDIIPDPLDPFGDFIDSMDLDN